MSLVVEVAYALQRNTPILRRFWSTQCRSRPNDQMSSRSLTIIPCEPSSPLDIHRSDPLKPNPVIPLRAQPDPTNPMNNRPSFSRCLAGATRTPPRPPDSPQSRPRPLVSSNGNLTSHAELGPPLFAEMVVACCRCRCHACQSQTTEHGRRPA